MTAVEPRRLSTLLVEDDPGDVGLVRGLLDRGANGFDVVRVEFFLSVIRQPRTRP